MDRMRATMYPRTAALSRYAIRRAAEQVPDLDARHRDERDKTVLERMAPQDTPFGQPLRARRADVVLSHHLEQ